MKAAVLERLKTIRIAEVPVPKAGPGSVLIRVRLCGVCGTDLLVYDGRSPVELPYRNLGHEYVGRIEEVGEGVRTVARGDRVVIDPNYHCDACRFCLRGDTGFCVNRRAFATKTNGGFAEYSAVAEKHVVRVPDGVADEQAIFAEPLSCCLHAIERVDPGPEDDLLIHGCGTMGLLMLQLCRKRSTGKILVSEPVAMRRKAAERFGADRTVDPRSEDLGAAVSALMPDGPRVVVESAGARSTIAESLRLIAPRGRLLLLATWGDAVECSFAPELAVRKEVSIIGTIFGTGALGRSLDLLASGRVRTDRLLSTVHPLERLDQAIREAGGREVIKVAIRTASGSE